MDEHGLSSEVEKEQKGHIPTSSEYEMCDMPSDAAIATQETTYEAILPNGM